MINVHISRHTYVSWLIYHVVDVVTIVKLVGHKDTTETLKTYSHLFNAKQEQSFDKVRNLMDKFWTRNTKSPSNRAFLGGFYLPCRQIQVKIS